MLKVGIIGAGTVSARHIEAYIAHKDCELVAISDVNEEQLKIRATQYKIERAYTDYHEILSDKEIDAVAIVTPTFTHKAIIIDALKAGKHVICEKPPTRTAQEAIECMEAAKKYGKILMYTFVRRFSAEVQYLKKYAEAGKFGQFVYAEAARTSRTFSPGGWMLDKEKVGGVLLDGNIHEIDSVLYIMGYPKVKSVTGFASSVNSDLPDRIQGIAGGYKTTDKTATKRTIDSITNGYVVFENGASLYIKTSSASVAVDVGDHIEIVGEKAGARIDNKIPDKKLRMLEVTDDNYFQEVYPQVGNVHGVTAEVKHFVDCCLNKAECMCKPEEAVMVMQIIDAIYESAETGKTIYF